MTVPKRKAFASLLTAGLLLASPYPVLAHGGGHGSAMTARHSTLQKTAAVPAPAAATKSTSTSSAAAAPPCTAASLSTCAGGLASSTLSTDASTAPGVTPPPFPAAAPPAPPALTAPTPAALAPIDAVESSGGGTSRTGGGGAAGPTLAQCMTIWEPALDMSKAEWKATCIRTLNGVDLPESGTQVAHRTPRSAHHATRRAAHAGGKMVSATDEQ